MSIQILPARLANQIAAGEVVERPASVVKELVENSIDAGATQIRIDIEKGGAKRIRITDNGSGIAKDELTLALSRHATSKIKNLDDLESINSLGFRGEALASISSVARLTLTSMTEGQSSAWQAIAIGRDMAVEVKPAAHPIGTTINVEDLFFNTPARRKFLRTEKTEFTHIDELVKRIALSSLELNITLTHNGKTVRQYRNARTDKQIEKRIASVCGQSFIDHAIKLEFKHDNLHLWGWIANPNFSRMQNDLCYSYVNNRMMRDKLINHAIRQAYGQRLLNDGYPAFVLFLNLDFSEVDVNVHPAKHEVRFHQSRFVHDFICSAVEQTLGNDLYNKQSSDEFITDTETGEIQSVSSMHENSQYAKHNNTGYIQPLREQQSGDGYGSGNCSPSNSAVSRGHELSKSAGYGSRYSANLPSQQAVENYQSLLTPIVVNDDQQAKPSVELNSLAQSITQGQFENADIKLLTMVDDTIALMELKRNVYCVNLLPIARLGLQKQLKQAFSAGIVSQPLLLPIKISITEQISNFIKQFHSYFELAGIYLSVNKDNVVIKQYPAQLREMDVQQSFLKLIDLIKESDVSHQDSWISAFAQLKQPNKINEVMATQMLINVNNVSNIDLFDELSLSSVLIDLTFYIKQLN